ncbi:MAG: hypothetical protein Q4D02_06730 [Clostridia bacterium]|nr:hypothetical protein [Clostridia bacterium]
MNYLETLKNIAKDKKKRTENIVFLIILLVILLIAINYIFTDKSDNNSNIDTSSTNINKIEDNGQISDSMEKKLEVILSQISGISDVSIVLTYSNNSKQNVVYNTKEEVTENEKSVEKNVAYNEENGKKSAIVESVELPKVEGAIVVARGASSVDIRSKIANAIANVLDIPVYKVQVFEKNS